MRLAFFVTPHGFGHATRAAALMQALAAARPDVEFVVLSEVPRWIFAESQPAPFELLPVPVDVGLVQRDALEEDLPATVQRLRALVPPPAALVDELAARLQRRRVQGVLCDIAPLGLAVARAAGLPSVLVENFTWDWIYEGYLGREPALAPFLEPLRDAIAAADRHIQARPVCAPRDGAAQVGPIGRAARRPAAEVRAELGVDPEQRLVLLTMGGVGFQALDRGPLPGSSDVVVAVTDGGRTLRREGGLLRVPQRGSVYFPDLLAASDLVAGKLGYSTVAEATLAGVPLVAMERPAFRETAVLAGHVVGDLGGVILSREAFQRGEWLSLSPPRVTPAAGGAVEAARLTLETVH